MLPALLQRGSLNFAKQGRCGEYLGSIADDRPEPFPPTERGVLREGSCVRIGRYSEVDQFLNMADCNFVAIIGTAGIPESLTSKAAIGKIPQIARVCDRGCVVLKKAVEGGLALSQIEKTTSIDGAHHAFRMHAIEGLRDAIDIGDVGKRGDPKPHLQIAGVWKLGAIPTGGALNLSTDNDLGRGDDVIACAAAKPEPVGSRPPAKAGAVWIDLWQIGFAFEVNGATVDHSDIWSSIHDTDCSVQAAGRQKVVG